MKFKNKFLLLIILTFSFILFFNINNVKGATYDLSTISHITNGANWAIADCTTSQNKILLFVCKEYPKYNYICLNNFSRNGCLCATTSQYSFRHSGSMYVYNLNDDGSFSLIGTIGAEGSNDYVIDNVIYSSVDIYYTSEHDEPVTASKLFFQQPPLETLIFQYPPEEPVLATIMEEKEITKEMEKTNLQIRVIIPLIIAVVVSFLGLRKALQMLSTILRRS